MLRLCVDLDDPVVSSVDVALRCGDYAVAAAVSDATRTNHGALSPAREPRTRFVAL